MQVNGTSGEKRREDADKSLVSELYKTMLECGGISDTAAELVPELKLEAAVRDIDSADIIMDLVALQRCGEGGWI